MSMDDKETLHRKARLRELIRECFDNKLVNLIRHIEETTGKTPNQGELSAIQKDNGGKSFGDKKAKTLTEQIGLSRRWFDMPLGASLDREKWTEEAPKFAPKIALTQDSQHAVLVAYEQADPYTRAVVDAILGIGLRPPWFDSSASGFIDLLKNSAKNLNLSKFF